MRGRRIYPIEVMLSQFRTLIAVLGAGALILGTCARVANAGVVLSMLGPDDFLISEFGYWDGLTAEEPATVPLSSASGAELASVDVAAPDLTANHVQLRIYSDAMEFAGKGSDSSFLVVSKVDRADHKFRNSGFGLKLLADSNHVLPMKTKSLNDIHSEVIQANVAATFSGDTDNQMIVAIVDPVYQIYAKLISRSSPLADPGNLLLISLGLVGFGYIGRLWSSYP